MRILDRLNATTSTKFCCCFVFSVGVYCLVLVDDEEIEGHKEKAKRRLTTFVLRFVYEPLL